MCIHPPIVVVLHSFHSHTPKHTPTQGNTELRQQLLALSEESENTEAELSEAVATKERLRKEKVELERKTRVAREAVDETKERLAAAEEGMRVCLCVDACVCL